MRKPFKAPPPNSRGQVLALSCVLLFVMAMTMMLSFNLTQGIHEKIRLQSHTDAVAYSVAAVEARAFNYLAYTNRAIAAGLVAQMGLHAWMSTASAAAATVEAGSLAFGILAVTEFLAAGFCPAPCCIMPMHCKHSLEAGIVAIKMFIEAGDISDKVNGHDSDFNDAVADLKTMVDEMHKDQRSVLDIAKSTLKIAVPVKMRLLNAPTSDLTTQPMVDGTNAIAFACALEGSNFDGDCTTRPKADPKVRSIVLENSANSARTLYLRKIVPSLGMDAHEDFRSNSKYLKDLQNSKGEVVVVRLGNAHVGEGYDLGSDNGSAVDSVGATNIVSYIVPTWEDLPTIGGSKAKIFSDSSGGKHENGLLLGSDSNHNKFLGAQKSDVCGNDENCFIHFRATDKKEDDFGQPTAYGAARQNLRTRPDTTKNFWEVNKAATIKIELVKDQPMELELAARKDALAVSKAKAYFHQPGNWKAPPNFFDPFWRAKLHPFHRPELVGLLKQVGAIEDSALAEGMPYEGDTR